MTIWGKLIGGTAGFALGGPLGAILGAFAGHAIDKRSTAPRVAGPTDRQAMFTVAVIVLGAKMAKADGRVTRDEVAVFRKIFHIPEHEMADVGRLFNQAKETSEGYQAYAHQIAGMFRGRPVVLEDLLTALFHIANADGYLHAAELSFLRDVANIFGFSSAQFERIKANFARPSQTDPYQVLGVDPAATEAEIKSTYRKLVREHHPDRAVAQGLPKEFIELANNKLAAINDAYDQIEKHRGMN